jgi:hypothetical protein
MSLTSPSNRRGPRKKPSPCCYPGTIRLETRPEEVDACGEAQSADDQHPYTGDDVDAALGDGADAAFLPSATAQQGVEAEGEAGHACEREQEAEGQGGGHEVLLALVPHAHHAGEEGAEAGVGA